MQSPEGITQLLIDWGNGDQAVLEKLMPLVYNELRRLATNYLHRERAGHTLQPTALVNEKPELPSGYSLGNYEILSFISCGGMGEVHLAQDKRLNRKVALKLLNETRAGANLHRRRFRGDDLRPQTV